MALFTRSRHDDSLTKSADSDVMGVNFFDELDSSKHLRAFLQNEWVYGAVKVKAEAIAAAKLRLFSTDSDGQTTELHRHPALRMMLKPNPYFTRYELMELCSMWLDLWGEAFFLIDKDSYTLTPLMPDRVQTKGSDREFITHYEYTMNGRVHRFKPEQILHFREANPANLYKGASPLQACARTFDSDVSASKWNHNFFRNNGMPSGILSFGGARFAEGVFQNFVRKFKKQYEGTSNAHKLAILEKTPEFLDLSKSQKDMQFAELADHSMRRILASFRVSKFLLGGTEDLNRATAEAAEYVFQKNSVLPRLRRIEERLNQDFLSLFPVKATERLFFTFDDPTPRNEELRIRKRESDAKIGARTVNELRNEEGLAPIEGGEKPLALSTKSTEEQNLEEDYKKHLRAHLQKALR